MTGLKSKKPPKRAETERCFLSAVLAELENYGDMRDVVFDFGARGVTWRHFRDRRHQALWRAMGELDLLSGPAVRRTALLEEMTPAEIDAERGDEGSAAWKDFEKRLAERSAGLAWLERELDAAGALALVGGKEYLRELAGVYPVSIMAGEFAKKLWWIKEP